MREKAKGRKSSQGMDLTQELYDEFVKNHFGDLAPKSEDEDTENGE